MKFQERIANYFTDTKAALIVIDALKYLLALFALLYSDVGLAALVQNERYVMVFHRRILNDPAYATAGTVYRWMISIGVALMTMWLLTLIKNLLKFTILRTTTIRQNDDQSTAKLDLPPYPYQRDSFAVVLAELQDRDGQRVPNPISPDVSPRWLLLPEKALYTGVFCTGAIGSGKTASLAEPILHQLIGHERDVPSRDRNAPPEKYRWSGIVTDEKGDFCAMTQRICEEWGRQGDFIRLAPEGYWKWNAIYNPNQASWAVGFTLSRMLKRFSRGMGSADPFWELAPKELLMDYLTLMEDADDYYNISGYLKVLIDQKLQDQLTEEAKERWRHNPARVKEVEARAARIKNRRSEYGQNLSGSLQACAKAGLTLFEYPEIRETFSPTRDEYFSGPCCPWPKRIPRNKAEERLFDEQHRTGIRIPLPNIFTGFDGILDRGKIIGLDMPKTFFYDAAQFIQIALKSAWQDAILRRDTRDANGELLVPPRFGRKIGYCPTFLVADECQETVDPGDQTFMAQARSKRACCVWLTQSHTSIVAAMGQGKERDADGFFQNCLTHVYFRQSDVESMKRIEKEVGLKDIPKTSVSITEGGQQSKVSYTAGDFVHDRMNVSETKSVQVEEKPYFETEQMKQLPDFVAIVIPSTGSTVLPATIGFMRPAFVYDDHPDISRETSWHDWPKCLKVIPCPISNVINSCIGRCP